MATHEVFHDATLNEPITESKAKGDCQCHGGSTATCCGLICFERPNYVCGHLLTDADLSLEQKYLREKQKLYHRTLTGHGVVCGLRLTCDYECSGYVRVGDGYAIDDCGNDLVVCEPKRFNVIAELRRKGYLVAESAADPCKPGMNEEDCDVRQCFFITACYEEEPFVFSTPFRAGCGSGPVECQPTRIRERVRLEVLDKLPESRSFLDQVEQRIAQCHKLFTDSAVSRKLHDRREVIERTLTAAPVEEKDTTRCDTFCELRVLFLHHLRQHPDPYNCETEKRVRDLQCPAPAAPQFANQMQEALTELLRLMSDYVNDCVAGEMAVPCPDVPKAGCVVLGTVEVERGAIRRVCNTPRQYVWAPANLVGVLLHDVSSGSMGTAARWDMATTHGLPTKNPPIDHSGPATGMDHERRRDCCPRPPFDPMSFVNQYNVDARIGYAKAVSFGNALRAFRKAIYRAFDFTSSHLIPTGLFRYRRTDAANVAQKLGLRIEKRTLSVKAQPGPYEAFMAESLREQEYPMLVYETDGQQDLYSDDLRASTPDFYGTANIDASIQKNSAAVEMFEGKIDGIREAAVEAKKVAGELVPKVDEAKDIADRADRTASTLVKTMEATARDIVNTEIAQHDGRIAEAESKLTQLNTEVTLIKKRFEIDEVVVTNEETPPQPKPRRRNKPGGGQGGNP